MNDFWTVTLCVIMFLYMMLFCLAAVWWEIVEVEAPYGKESLYKTLVIIWPVSVILLAPIILVYLIKGIVVGTKFAGSYTFKALGEVGSIYKAVIKS